MGQWTAIALPSVTENALLQALESKGFLSDSTVHVSATASHARAMRSSGLLSAAIANLVDLVVMTGLDDKYRLDIADFPSGGIIKGAEDSQLAETKYRERLKTWQHKLRSHQTRTSLSANTELRRFLRQPQIDSSSARVLLDSKREFLKAIQGLIAAGVEPRDLEADDVIGQVAVSAWKKLEQAVPVLTAVRDDLWDCLDHFENPSSKAATNLRNRVNNAFEQIFAVGTQEITVVYHGFYFFTPPQWAFFQLVRKMPNINQVFVLHDDGESPVFETWRRFFCEGWGMPRVELISGENTATIQASAFRAALEGAPIHADSLVGKLDIKECASPAEFVRQLNSDRSERSETSKKESLAFAPNSADLKRLTSRLSRATADGKSDLSQLPIGSFLLAAHACIKRNINQAVTIELSAKAVLDMVSSGFLDTAASKPSESLRAFQAVMPFFSDCLDRTSWKERAVVLHRLVLDEVAPRGERLSTQTDLISISKSVSNPLRRVPWLDISIDESHLIQKTIENVCDLVSGIASGEEVKLKEYLDFLSRHLERALEEISEEHRKEVVDKFNSFKFQDDEVAYVDDLVDIVHLLVSSKNDFGFFDDDDSDLDSAVTELRTLDALGFKRLDRPLHVANLADGVFPSKVNAIGWPFKIASIDNMTNDAPRVSVEIMKSRSQNSSLSDLYLLWLALDGVNDGHKVTLSWISDTGREEQNLSPVVSILAVPSRINPSVIRRVGGVPITSVETAADLPPVRQCIEPANPTIREEDLKLAIAKINPQAVSASVFCARRFAIQWALGNSSSFLASHHQAILYGNTIGALAQLDHITDVEALNICNDIWRFMSIGERASSRFKAVVKVGGAKPEWLLTLDGNRRDDDTSSLTYQHATSWKGQDRKQVSLSDVVPVESRFLPPRNVSSVSTDICKHCPVSSKCNAAERHD
jgi:hypothetical protein